MRSSAQSDLCLQSHFLKDTTQHVLISTYGNYFFASDVITNQFAGDYYQRKFISTDDENSITKNLSDQNIFGGEANWQVALTFRPDTSNHHLQAYIAYRNRGHVDSKFSKDFFELYFRGNKMFGGKTADMSDFSYHQYSYRQFVFGISNEFSISNSGKLFIGADIAINNGISFLKIETGGSSLYTDPIGEYIDADLHATIQTDDSASQHPSKLDGTGYAGDFYLEYETENSIVAFSVENFGSIHWNKWSTEVSIDSTFHFDGIDVRDLFDLKDSVKINTSFDSTFYQNFIQNRKEQRITTDLPIKVSGSYTRSFPENKLSATLGIDILLKTNSTMRYIAALNYQVNRSNQIGLVMASGGYTTFHAGLSIVHLFPWHLKFEIGSSYVYPMITYKTGKSQGTYLSLSKSF